MPRARWLTNAVLAVGSLLVSLFAAEVVLRGFVQLPMRRVLPEVRYAPHPVRRFTLVPNQQAFTYGAPVRIDARGFRANGDTRPPADARSEVLALGDSFTFGLGVRDHETWPAQLEQALVKTLGRPAEVVNAGTISYGVFQELDLLRTAGLATRPRIVIHALYWNDFMSASPPAPGAPAVVDANGYLTWDALDPPGTLRHVAALATTSSALVFSVRQAASTYGRSDKGGQGYAAEYRRFLETGLTAQDWEPIDRFYQDFKRIGAEHDFTPFVVIMPMSELTGGDMFMHAFPAAAREMLGRLGIPFLDAFGLWSGRRHGEYFLSQGADAHLNPEGYRFVAEATARALLGNPILRARLQQ